MTEVFLYDDLKARTFEPFALTRPAGEMRAGAELVHERWRTALGATEAFQLSAQHLLGFDEPQGASVISRPVPIGAWLVNARFCPVLKQVNANSDVLTAGGRVVAVRVRRPLPLADFLSGMFTLESVASSLSDHVEGWWMDEVWDYVAHLVPMLESDLPIIAAGLDTFEPRDAIRIGTHGVHVENGAVIEPSVCFDASAGPIVIRAGAHVQAFTRLVGPLFIGAHCQITADRIAASSIGEVCKVHGELSNSIFIGHANKGHDGFVGHSILGRWVNLGAGTITSNLKNTYGTVALWTPSGIRDTKLQFLGTLFGDHAKTGIGLRLTTGTVLGAGCNVYGSAMPPKAVAPFSWGEAGAFSEYRFDKFLAVAERMMRRRHIALSESARGQLAASFAAKWAAP